MSKKMNVSQAILSVSPSPHVSNKISTSRLMVDVILAMLPVMAVSFYVFREALLFQVFVCVISCLSVEYICCRLRKRKDTLGDFSAAVTGLILALSLPWSAPWYVGFIASLAAIGLGKAVFGGLGQNIFNPAMVGRAFVFIAFPALAGPKAYVSSAESLVDAVAFATPLSKEGIADSINEIMTLFIGNCNGSLGETSVVACLLGGGYLCYRRTASWEIPLSMILTASVTAFIFTFVFKESYLFVFHHIFSGALFFGAFFIATDPVTSPMSCKGKMVFGALTGFIIMIIRFLSGYPEGVMFSILIVNSLTPLIDRYTIPKPVGGRVAVSK